MLITASAGQWLCDSFGEVLSSTTAPAIVETSTLAPTADEDYPMEESLDELDA